MENPIPEKYRSDHLFLTVDTNPLPNYVAARLLSKKSSTIYLLHSDGAESTQKAAEQLEEALYEKDDKDLTIRLEPIPSANNLKIEQRVGEIARGLGLGSIGLNYSGGTKPMSIHSHRAIERALSVESRPRPVFSYLDPRQLALHIDGHGTEPSQTFRAHVEMRLEELIALHGYKRSRSRREKWAKPENTVGLLELCAEIAQVHTTYDGISMWESWTSSSSKPFCNYNTLPTDASLVMRALDKLCAGSATPYKVAAKLLPNVHRPHLTACHKWLSEDWLTEHSLACVAKLADKFQINSKEKHFAYFVPPNHQVELDVAAMIGHQLFAISCQTSRNEDTLKLRLLQTYFRARQLGGDEARVALVCCVDDKAVLENEIKREWQAEGKIRVFDRHDLRDLAGTFGLWFQTANQR